MDLHDLNALKQDATNGSLGDFATSCAKPVPLATTMSPPPPPLPPRSLSATSSSVPQQAAPISYAPPYFPTGASMFNPSAAYAAAASYPHYSSMLSSPYSLAALGGGTTGTIGSLNHGGSLNNNSNSNGSNSFLRAAEENSRAAFQSIESVVYAFSAVSAMFESTYLALFNSFRAIVGVADQFYRLKTHLSGILSMLAVARFLGYLYRRCMRFLLRMSRLVARRTGLAGSDDVNWLLASKEQQTTFSDLNGVERIGDINNGNRTSTNWPLVMFMGVVLGGPYLIWKILSSINSLKKDDRLWMNGDIDHFVGVGEHDFDAINSDELNFRRGQRITIAPKEYQPTKLRGWLLASVDGKTSGLVPANYLKIMGKKIGKNSSPDSTRAEM